MPQNKNIALLASLSLTLGLSAGGFLLLQNTAPDLLPSLLGQSRDNGGSRRTKGTFKVLGDTFSGYSTFRNDAFQDALGEPGIRLEYADEFDQSQRAQALEKGKADFIATTLDQFLKQKPKGKIVGLIDRTVGADAVVLNTRQFPQLKSLINLSQLVKQGKSKQYSIVYAGDTPSEYLALVLDTKFDAFNLSDFRVIKVEDASQAWKLMQDTKENVAIAVLWEPFVSQARKQGHTVVLSSEDAPNTIVDVLVASDKVIQSQPEQISAFLAAYYRRIESGISNRSQLQDQIATDGELSAPDADTVLKGINFFTALEAQDWMQKDALNQRITATSAVLVLSGTLTQVPDNPTQLYDPQFVSQAADNTKKLIDIVRADNPELAKKLEGQPSSPQKTAKPTADIKSAPSIGNLKVRGEVKFAVGAANLTSTGRQTLDKLSKEIEEFNPDTIAVRVIGHTSKSGSASLNQSLSQQRAQVVVQYLKKLGIKQAIQAEGKGFSTPLPGIPPGDARNQRTEIRLVRIS
ncbi:OmpA family protein [Acaryochloris sp. 'Moss Beach']|uniref:phosphate ABC transporter substrate-binding/OmpA family protein n=1 Tax=Acaryochloris sp. 'Moss Beach' TaxID=2740837 RepID=UPI001F326F32|nr:phosphate ABC transporter substrate-binding/OmpA family protein [Acaryochloris sp. 'Moss Beach']UJB69960.1 OmpA family protein [Acaryochloris sp. 'Moss Beach']